MAEHHDLSLASASRQDLVLERRDIIEGIALMAGGSFAAALSSATAHAKPVKADKSANLNSTSSVVASDDSAVVAVDAQF